MTKFQEELLKNNPNFLEDFLEYSSVGKNIQFTHPKKETKKEYQHRYYEEVTKKKRQEKRNKDAKTKN